MRAFAIAGVITSITAGFCLIYLGKVVETWDSDYQRSPAKMLAAIKDTNEALFC